MSLLNLICYSDDPALIKWEWFKFQYGWHLCSFRICPLETDWVDSVKQSSTSSKSRNAFCRNKSELLQQQHKKETQVLMYDTNVYPDKAAYLFLIPLWTLIVGFVHSGSDTQAQPSKTFLNIHCLPFVRSTCSPLIHPFPLFLVASSLFAFVYLVLQCSLWGLHAQLWIIAHLPKG